jgi:hypothetical protein
MGKEIFTIDSKEDTPMVIMEKDGEYNSIIIKGISMPENALEFYQPFTEKIFSFFNSFSNTTLDINLGYMNSMSNKQILKLIHTIYEKSNDLIVIWQHEKNDELIKIKGEEFQSIFPNINIILKEF